MCCQISFIFAQLVPIRSAQAGPSDDVLWLQRQSYAWLFERKARSWLRWLRWLLILEKISRDGRQIYPRDR